MYKDRLGNLWLGAHDNGGIFLFDEKTKGFFNFFPDPNDGKSISCKSVFVMYETRAGQFWIGGDRCLDLFDRNTHQFIHHQHDLKKRQTLGNNMVYSILEDHAGNLWLGTAGGLNFFDIKTKVFTTYTEKNGLANNTVWAIQEDRHGNMWISTNNGLSRFNPSTKIFRNYTITDGLQSNTFKDKASYQSPDGEMFFGGVNGFNTFYPDSLKENDFMPPVLSQVSRYLISRWVLAEILPCNSPSMKLRRSYFLISNPYFPLNSPNSTLPNQRKTGMRISWRVLISIGIMWAIIA